MPIKRMFRCARTGVLYPEDYIEEWGRKYGIGLGPEPISEALVNDYFRPVSDTKRPNAMHPLAVSRAQVDLIDIDDASPEYKANITILEIDDPTYQRRALLMRDKQLQKSASMKNLFPTEIQAATDRLAAGKY